MSDGWRDVLRLSGGDNFPTSLINLIYFCININQQETTVKLLCMDKYSVLYIWYTIFLIHLLWDWGIIKDSKFRSWYKAIEYWQLSECMNVSTGAPSVGSRNVPY